MNTHLWNTYATTGYTHDVANDPPSTGGVHLHQVRRSRDGRYLHRIAQSNGGRVAYGPVEEMDAKRGSAAIAAARGEG